MSISSIDLAIGVPVMYFAGNYIGTTSGGVHTLYNEEHPSGLITCKCLGRFLGKYTKEGILVMNFVDQKVAYEVKCLSIQESCLKDHPTYHLYTFKIV